MAFRWGNGQPVHEFDLPLTQDHLGEATGLTSVHVNRVLRSLRNDGLVLCRSRRVQILNWPLLCCEAEFDESYLLANVRQAERLAA
jgi:DNA-binding transcriptional regulator LsrR (DeoR family)